MRHCREMLMTFSQKKKHVFSSQTLESFLEKLCCRCDQLLNELPARRGKPLDPAVMQGGVDLAGCGLLTSTSYSPKCRAGDRTILNVPGHAQSSYERCRSKDSSDSDNGARGCGTKLNRGQADGKDKPNLQLDIKAKATCLQRVNTEEELLKNASRDENAMLMYINMSLTVMERSCFCSDLCYYRKNGELLPPRHSFEAREDICAQQSRSLVKPFKKENHDKTMFLHIRITKRKTNVVDIL